MHWITSDTNATLPVSYLITSDGGAHAFASGVVLNTSGYEYLTASDTVSGSVSGTQSNI